MTDGDEPVPAGLILRQLLAVEGTPLDALPPDLLGSAVEVEARQPAIASRSLQGILVADGRVLLVTITADHVDWARLTWLSIQYHPAGRPDVLTPAGTS